MAAGESGNRAASEGSAAKAASTEAQGWSISSMFGKKAKAGAPSKLKVPSGELPKTPAIAAHASGVAQGGSFGGHASVYLAVPYDGQLEYYFIDLVLNQSGDKKGAIDIRIKDLRGGWPGENTSTTWSISTAGAQSAHFRAQGFARYKDTYKYNYFGIGKRAYNCALFAEKILQAAGVNQSSGLIFSTPLEAALGKKVPKMRKREKKQKGPAPIPAQYDV